MHQKSPIVINTFIKVNYKANAVAFLYTNDKHTELGIKETIPLTLASKSLGLNLTKEAEDLYFKNFKKLEKIEGNIRRWKYLPFSWIGRINIVKIHPTKSHLQSQYNSQHNISVSEYLEIKRKQQIKSYV